MKRVLIAWIILALVLPSVGFSYDPFPQRFFPEKLSDEEIIKKFEATVSSYNSKNDDNWVSGEIISRCLSHMRKKAKPEFLAPIERVTKNTNSPLSIRVYALKVYYSIGGDKDYLRELIEGDNDKLRAAALDLIAWDVPEQELDAIIDRLYALKDSENYNPSVGLGYTGNVLSLIRHVRTGDRFYNSQKDPHKKIQLLMDCISIIETQFAHSLNENLQGRFWLSKHKEVFKKDRAGYLKAMSFHLENKPCRKRRTVVMVLGQLGMTDEDINTLFPKKEEKQPTTSPTK